MNETSSKSDPQRIQINPHIEAHGNYSVEWSYHFPLEPGMTIESEFELTFPVDDVPGAARVSLSEANLSTTRLSFADVAAQVRVHSLQFLRDTMWILGALGGEASPLAIQGGHLSPSEVRKFFLHKAREYWTPAFFSRVGVILQSDLKQARTGIREVLAEADTSQEPEWSALALQKGRLLASLRSAFRLVAAHKAWERVFEPNAHLFEDAGFERTVDAESNQAFLTQVSELAELAIILVSQYVAELQGLFTEKVNLFEEHLSLLRNRKIYPQEEGDLEEEFARITLGRLIDERAWLSQWARLCGEWRLLCGLVPLSDVVADANVANAYFERLRELKKKHYHFWDLDIQLRSSERAMDFWIGGGAAAVSAAFAFAGTYFWVEAQFTGQVSFREQGMVALSIFAMGNVIVYVLKDRLKEWLKVKLRNVLNVRSGYWQGDCGMRIQGAKGHGERMVSVADVERETRWRHAKEQLKFVVWETFRIKPDARTTNARIVKQVWRLPLDEILHSLDNSRHVLRLPTIEGEPQQVPVLKRSVFTYRFTVSVQAWKNRERRTVDYKTISGRVIATGDRISHIE